ncbi:hypothetical protein EVAR_10073_1 [Eumeta japonica]|uniref:Uncharacterized protein n=1 Tax=Eumeta variegata TaxID=151549 RepID=A0A4C1TRG7_EUMVA|nr:hypothetical protein EVAR_10073_1 [Eumeta japonica]
MIEIRTAIDVITNSRSTRSIRPVHGYAVRGGRTNALWTLLRLVSKTEGGALSLDSECSRNIRSRGKSVIKMYRRYWRDSNESRRGSTSSVCSKSNNVQKELPSGGRDEFSKSGHDQKLQNCVIVYEGS